MCVHIYTYKAYMLPIYVCIYTYLYIYIPVDNVNNVMLTSAAVVFFIMH